MTIKRKALRVLYRIYQAQGRLDDAALVYRLLLAGWVNLDKHGGVARTLQRAGFDSLEVWSGSLQFRV